MKSKSLNDLFAALTSRRSTPFSGLVTRQCAFVFAVALAALVGSQSAHAADSFYDTDAGTAGLQGGTAPSDWAITSPYFATTIAGAPQAGGWLAADTAIFQTGVANSVNIAVGGVAAVGLTLNHVANTTGSSLTLTGGALSGVSGGFTNNANGAFSIGNSAVNMGTANGVFNGTGNFAIGALWNSSATAGAIGITPSATTIGNSITFTNTIDAGGAVAGRFQLVTNGVGSTLTISNPIVSTNTMAAVGGTFTINPNGSANIIFLNAANTFTLGVGGTVSIGGNNNGIIGIGNDAAFGNAANVIALNQSKFSATGGDRTVANPLSVAGTSSSVVGANNLTFSTAATVAASAQLYNFGTGTLAFTAGYAKSAALSLTLGGSGNTTVSGAVTGGGTGQQLIVSALGSGTVTLAGTNSALGTTTVNGGTLALNYATNDTTKLADASALVLNGGAVSLRGATGSHVELATGLTLGSNTNGSASEVSRSGLNTATLSVGAIARAANNGASLNVQSGVLVTSTGNTNGILGGYATADKADWAVGTGPSPVNALATYNSGGEATWGATENVATADDALTGNRPINTLKITGGTALNLGGFALTSNAAGAGGILFTGGSDYTISSGNIAAGGTTDLVIHQHATGAGTAVLNITSNIASRLVKSGLGTVDLTGNSGGNNYTGQTVINDGTLVISQDNQLGVVANGIAINGGTLKSTGANVNLGARPIFLSAEGGSVEVTGSNVLTSSGIISGGAAALAGLTKTGSGTLALSGASTFNGGLKILGGTVTTTAVANNNLPSPIGNNLQQRSENLVLDGGTLSFVGGAAGASNRPFLIGAGGGTLQGNGTVPAAALTWSGSPNSDVRDAARSLTLGGAYTNATTGNVFSGSLTDSGTGALSLTKADTGTWSLTATNTYSGATTVSAGSLFVNGALTESAITVNGLGRLGGTGSVRGDTTVNGTLGAGPGPVVATGTLTLGTVNLLGTLDVEYNGATIDLVSAGALSLGSLSTVNFLNLGAISAPASVFMSYTSLTGTFNTINTIPAGYSIDYAYNNGINSNNIALVIPETSTALLGALGSLALLRRRRR